MPNLPEISLKDKSSILALQTIKGDKIMYVKVLGSVKTENFDKVNQLQNIENLETDEVFQLQETKDEDNANDLEINKEKQPTFSQNCLTFEGKIGNPNLPSLQFSNNNHNNQIKCCAENILENNEGTSNLISPVNADLNESLSMPLWTTPQKCTPGKLEGNETLDHGNKNGLSSVKHNKVAKQTQLEAKRVVKKYKKLQQTPSKAKENLDNLDVNNKIKNIHSISSDFKDFLKKELGRKSLKLRRKFDNILNTTEIVDSSDKLLDKVRKLFLKHPGIYDKFEELAAQNKNSELNLGTVSLGVKEFITELSVLNQPSVQNEVRKILKEVLLDLPNAKEILPQILPLIEKYPKLKELYYKMCNNYKTISKQKQISLGNQCSCQCHNSDEIYLKLRTSHCIECAQMLIDNFTPIKSTSDLVNQSLNAEVNTSITAGNSSCILTVETEHALRFTIATPPPKGKGKDIRVPDSPSTAVNSPCSADASSDTSINLQNTSISSTGNYFSL